MRGSKPERAAADDVATLEEVFTSRAFGHPLPEAPRPAVPTAVVGPRLFFVRNRLVASGAAVAAALSVVGGVSIGPGPLVQSALSSHSGAPAPAVATPTTTPPSPAATAPVGSVAGQLGGGNQPSGATQVSHAPSPTVPVRAIAAGVTPSPSGSAAPTATLTAVGTGSSVPTAGGTNTSTPPSTPTDHHDHHHDAHRHHDDHPGVVRRRRCSARRRRERERREQRVYRHG